MLTQIQKATLKNLAQNDPELIRFLGAVSAYINGPKIFSHLLLNGIKGAQLKRLALSEYAGEPERFVKGMMMRINGKRI